MYRRKIASPLIRCALGIVFLALFASASSASVIYEYRELDSTAVIGTLERKCRSCASGVGGGSAG